MAEPVIASQSPRVTVIIPAYNAAPYIVEALESVFAQTYTSYEVIVINDGSPDTPQLEQAIKVYRDRISYLKQPNKGAAAARNTAIRAAAAEYIALLDADDVWEPTFLADQLGYLRENPGVDLVYGDAVFLGGHRSGQRYMDICPSSGEATFEALVSRRCHVMIGIVAKRTAIIAAGLFSESLRRCEDFEMWGRFAKAGYRIGYHRNLLMKYGRAGQGKSSQAVEHLLGEIAVYEKFRQELALSEAEQLAIDTKLMEYSGELLLLQAKAAFNDKRFRDAASKVSAANAVLLRYRLAMVFILLCMCPNVIHFVYMKRAAVARLRVSS
jgi:glycosyltransferase involved in cell wall biosynthesis